MKVMTILGTRPEIIRLSRIIPLLDACCNHYLVHTGQNYDYTLNDVFFEELNLRRPDMVINSRSQTPMQEIGQILVGCEQVIHEQQPDRILLLGDTNSALAAIAAKRSGIPVFHMEAGNRCFDDRVPEEINRRIIDHCSDILMPYTERSRANLIREGIPGHRIYVTGNPIMEVLNYYEDRIASRSIMADLSLNPREYFLVTLHRAENVDQPLRLKAFIEALESLATNFRFPVICSLHPRTRSQLERQGQVMSENIRPVRPLGLFDFIHLEKNAFCVLSDSGTVQEECCIFNIPNVTLRDVTERPETIEAGSNILSGCDLPSIRRAVQIAITTRHPWNPPPEYLTPNVSETVIKVVLGYNP